MTQPYSGISLPQPGQSIQRMRRAWRIFTDQHGRRFGAQAEMSNNQPIAEFQPLTEKGFGLAPWYPPMRYAKWREVGELEFAWDYRSLADEWSGGTASYYDEATKLALQLPGDIPVPDVGGEVDRRIRAILGVAPLSPVIPLACEMGDPWMLGVLGAPVNETLRRVLDQTGGGANGKGALQAIREQLAALRDASAVPMVPTIPEKPQVAEKARTIHDPQETEGDIMDVTWPEFLAAAKKRGRMTLPEIGVAWQEFKKERKDAEAAA